MSEDRIKLEPSWKSRVGDYLQPRYSLPLLTILAVVAMARLDGNAFRIAPALTVGPSEIEEALGILRESFEAAGAR